MEKYFAFRDEMGGMSHFEGEIVNIINNIRMGVIFVGKNNVVNSHLSGYVSTRRDLKRQISSSRGSSSESKIAFSCKDKPQETMLASGGSHFLNVYPERDRLPACEARHGLILSNSSGNLGFDNASKDFHCGMYISDAIDLYQKTTNADVIRLLEEMQIISNAGQGSDGSTYGFTNMGLAIYRVGEFINKSKENLSALAEVGHPRDFIIKGYRKDMDKKECANKK